MDAVVTAGGIPQPDEPLYAYTQGRLKSHGGHCRESQ